MKSSSLQVNGVRVDYSGEAVLYTTDQDLLERVQKRDREAFETLYDRHSLEAMSVAFQVLLDRERAEQVLLDAFWWLWKNISLARAANVEFSDWFYRIVRHQALVELERQMPLPNSASL